MVIDDQYVIALLATAGSWIVANAGTIIAFAVKYIKLKAQEAKKDKEYKEIMEDLSAKFESEVTNLYKEVSVKLDLVEAKVKENQIILAETERAEIENEKLAITEAVNDIKKSLSLDDIINN